eukprot:maker-scaffold427_size174323-snap-gene-0.42 protein:Tk04509 transcript:maker-scaffold427_size174323-snap-gene-0.42-mRNA-1 annotation:"hypothetical protein DAPPUDRAFT_326408"
MGKRLLVGGASSVVAGIILVVFGACLQWVIFPIVLEDQLYKQLDLREGTEGYKAWLDPPVPVFMNFYFFNVTNTAAVATGAKPELVEIGPYCFREDRLKQDILELNAEHLQYGLYLAYHYDQAETERQGCQNGSGQPCSRTDQVTILNVVLAAIAQLLGNAADGNPLLPVLKDLLITFNDGVEGKLAPDCIDCEDELFTTASVLDFTFEGVPSGSLKALKHSLEIHATTGILGILGLDEIPLPEEFFFFMGKNGTKNNQYFTINNGRYTRNKFLEVEKFNGETTLKEKWWPRVGPTPSATASGMGGICHDILGTDGTQFPAYIDKRVRRWLFVPEMCRSIWLDYVKDTKFLDIDAYEYRASEDVFDMDNPNNFCYCPGFLDCKIEEPNDTYNNIECKKTCKDGMIFVGSCYGGVPVVMTAPHFFRGDESLISDVIGIKPDLELHDTIMLVEPLSGAPLMAHKRIQINLDLKKSKYVTKLEKVKDLLFPVIWADENAGINDELADLYKNTLVLIENLVLGISIAFGFILGAALIVVGIFMCWKG